MSYYAKDINEPCACANATDAAWFTSNPSRAKHLRRPWACEETALDDDQVGVVTQVVAVWIDASINDIMKIPPPGIIPVRVHRRSFLFIGNADWHRVDSDEAVDRFMEFINDGSGGLVSVSIN